jgi:hypothetical protein
MQVTHTTGKRTDSGKDNHASCRQIAGAISNYDIGPALFERSCD